MKPEHQRIVDLRRDAETAVDDAKAALDSIRGLTNWHHTPAPPGVRMTFEQVQRALHKASANIEEILRANGSPP